MISILFADEDRHLFLVSVKEDASPQDLTFLATIPAACHLNGGKPVVIAVGGGELPPEVDDFIKRYKPGRTVKGRIKTGHSGSLQNRPLDLISFYLTLLRCRKHFLFCSDFSPYPLTDSFSQ
jgi:hypothetical protein